MKQELLKIKEEILNQSTNIKSAEELEILKNKYFSRKQGKLTLLLKNIKDLPANEKKDTGIIANEIRQEIEKALFTLENKFSVSNATNNFDTSLPGKISQKGTLHPLTQVRLEVEEVFKSMGFQIYEGLELTNLHYNFLTLNFPPNHPAMDGYDTFYIKESDNVKLAHKQVMRAHTSNTQVMVMEKAKPPIKALVPGRTFRHEATDASHEHTFHQIEGFVVGKNITIANLIWTQKKLLSAIFHQDVKVRLRPGYFPFVEPGFELDCSCLICGGKGCSVCKHKGWVELIPCGMIHPNVLVAAGYKRGEYSGFAFGMGWSRLAMMKYGINDIRLFMSGDLRFLKQF